MPNVLGAKLPCEFLCICLLKFVWDETCRNGHVTSWCGNHILRFEPTDSCQMSKEPCVSLVAPYLASLAQQIPIFLSPEATTVDLPTCAIQLLRNHFSFAVWVHTCNRPLRSRSASCASTQVNKKAPSAYSKCWSSCKTTWMTVREMLLGHNKANPLKQIKTQRFLQCKQCCGHRIKNIGKPKDGDDTVCKSWHQLDLVMTAPCFLWVSANTARAAVRIQSRICASVSSSLSQLLNYQKMQRFSINGHKMKPMLNGTNILLWRGKSSDFFVWSVQSSFV